MSNADPIRRLILAFSRLPGIGEKTATRLAFFILNNDEMIANDLAGALTEARSKVRLCETCCTLTEAPICKICSDARRDDRTICVVESVQSLFAVETTGEYRGRYHVLHGLLSPLDGIGPEQLHLQQLVARLNDTDEIIVATSPSVEGEATALYLQRLCQPFGVKVTRIASGIPMGTELEYADHVTLARALESRREL